MRRPRAAGRRGSSASSTSPAAEATALALGPFAGKAVAGAIVLSAAGILNTICLGFPFVIYAMAKDRVFFARAGALDARTGRPAVAVAMQGTWACAAVLLGSSRVDVILTAVTFAGALGFAAVAIVHLRVRSTSPPEGALRVPAIAAWFYLVVQIGLAVGSFIHRPIESMVGAGMLAVGVAAWSLWRRS
jgi:APA family basic amino acid/polyamine antiporter